ncbi:MAG: M48 family metallopeptidase [Solirubrobacterales bacterium]
MSADRERPNPMKASSLVWVGLAALLFAYLVSWLLAPGGSVDPKSLSAGDYFNPALVERAQDFRSERRLIAIGAMLAEFATLAFLAFYRGSPLRSFLRWATGHTWRGAALAGAGISLTVAAVRFPFSLLAFNQGRDYGLVTQGHWGWLTDFLLAALIGCLLAAIGAIVAVWLWRRFQRRFWIAGSALVVAYAIVFVWLWPVLVSPLFNDFTPLPEGPVRSKVLRLADEAGVDVGQVYEVDASRRSSTLNASVNGIGSSKRVVIYDNAINELSGAELSALIAHELGHVESNDLYRGLGFALLVIPLGVLFVQVGTAVIVRGRGDDDSGPAILPALALMVAVATLVLTVPGNVLSRDIEIHADAFAMELTGDPESMIGLQQQLGDSNLTDPDPPAIYQYVFGTHPTILERIGVAEALRAGEDK